MNAFAPYRENQATDSSFSDFHDVFAALSEDSSMLPSSVTCESDDDTDVPSASIAPPRQRKRKFTGHMPAQSTSQPSFLPRNALSAVTASGAALAPTTTSTASASLPPAAPRSAATLRHVARQRASTAWPNVYMKKLRRFVSDPDSGLDGDHADDEEEEDEDFVNSPYLSPTVSPTRRQVTTHFGGGGFGVGVGVGDESLEPYMKILEQPESHYRARYACEGCRGPMKSRSGETTNENVFPTVQIMNYMGSATVNVYLVTTSGDPHYHVLVPGSSRTSNCKASLVDGTPSLELSLNGEEMEDMIAVLDNLSIRRLRRWEGDRKLKNRGVDPATFKKDRVQAALMFQATIFTQDGVRVLKCQSEPFQCTAPKGSPEISWISHDSGPASGGNEIGLIGSRFNKGCKVRFYNDNWETYATLDRAKSNQGGAVVEVPPFENVSITEPEKVCIEIRIGPEKNPQLSDPVEYTYMPEKGSGDTDCSSQQCSTCRELAPFINMFALNVSGGGNSGNNEVLPMERPKPEPKRKSSGFANFMAACPPPAEVVNLLSRPASPPLATTPAEPSPSPSSRSSDTILRQPPPLHHHHHQSTDESLPADMVLCQSSGLSFPENSLELMLGSDQVRLLSMAAPAGDLTSLPLVESYNQTPLYHTTTQPGNGSGHSPTAAAAAAAAALLSGQVDASSGGIQGLF